MDLCVEPHAQSMHARGALTARLPCGVQGSEPPVQAVPDDAEREALQGSDIGVGRGNETPPQPALGRLAAQLSSRLQM
jgi:hypothetical protein